MCDHGRDLPHHSDHCFILSLKDEETENSHPTEQLQRLEERMHKVHLQQCLTSSQHVQGFVLLIASVVMMMMVLLCCLLSSPHLHSYVPFVFLMS